MAVCGVVPVAAVVPLFPSIVHIPSLCRGTTTILLFLAFHVEVDFEIQSQLVAAKHFDDHVFCFMVWYG